MHRNLRSFIDTLKHENELTEVTAQVAREDLFTAIIDPNLEVSPAFRTTLVATNSGQVYHGLIVYESPEGTLLQTGPDTTIDVVGEPVRTKSNFVRGFLSMPVVIPARYP